MQKNPKTAVNSIMEWIVSFLRLHAKSAFDVIIKEIYKKFGNVVVLPLMAMVLPFVWHLITDLGNSFLGFSWKILLEPELSYFCYCLTVLVVLCCVLVGCQCWKMWTSEKLVDLREEEKSAMPSVKAPIKEFKDNVMEDPDSREGHNFTGKVVKEKMPRSEFSGTISRPKVEVAIHLGKLLFNACVDGFLKIGIVATIRAAAEGAFHAVKKGSVSKHDFEHTLKNMCKEGAYWGAVAGVYVGAVYGVSRIRGRRDWKNAMIGGALTGAVISAATSSNKDRIVVDVITGGAIATAAEFLNYLTRTWN